MNSPIAGAIIIGALFIVILISLIMNPNVQSIRNRYNFNVVFEVHEDHVLVSCDKSAFTRCGFDGDNEQLYFVDFEGGPMISVGNNLSSIWSSLPTEEVVAITQEENKFKLHLNGRHSSDQGEGEDMGHSE